MHYVGLDLHMRRSNLHILDANGKSIKHRQVLGALPRVIEMLAAEAPRPFAVCFEASCGYGHAHDQLRQLADRVVVAHPGQVRLIFKSKRKNDRIDAGKLAKLLYLDAVPSVHVPRRDVRGWRGLIEFRQRLLGRRVAVKNQLRALLRGLGIGVPAARPALFSKRGLAWLAEQPLDPSDALRRDMLIDELAEHTNKIQHVERELAKIAVDHPGVALLRTIPGVGIRTAEALVAYIDDVRRFARVGQVGCYFGLVPCQDSSAGANRFGHITRDGPATVRKLLCEASWQGIRRSPTLRRAFERIARGDRDRRKIALVAVAHQLCRISAAMLRSGECWREDRDEDRDDQSPHHA